MRFEDEELERPEGEFLSHILNLHEKTAIYYYIRTLRELEEVLKLFWKRAYRFLYISCHGASDSIHTTIETIQFPELSNTIGPYLTHVRLFLSACEAVNDDLASELFLDTQIESLIGPAEEIHFGDAAITWASFYHLAFKMDPTGMERYNVLSALQKVVNAFKSHFVIIQEISRPIRGIV